MKSPMIGSYDPSFLACPTYNVEIENRGSSGSHKAVIICNKDHVNHWNNTFVGSTVHFSVSERSLSERSMSFLNDHSDLNWLPYVGPRISGTSNADSKSTKIWDVIDSVLTPNLFRILTSFVNTNESFESGMRTFITQSISLHHLILHIIFGSM